MSDYSDLIFLIGAMVIYGLLVTDANRAIVTNNQKLTNSEVAYGAISVAQDVIEKARWMDYTKVLKNRLENYAKRKLENVGGARCIKWYYL